MANTFKVVTKSGVSASSGTPTNIYTVPANTTTVVLGLLLANRHSSNVSATVILSSDTSVSGAATNADAYVIKDVAVETGSSLEIMAGQKYVLGTTDILKVYADNANLDLILSFMEVTP